MDRLHDLVDVVSPSALPLQLNAVAIRLDSVLFHEPNEFSRAPIPAGLYFQYHIFLGHSDHLSKHNGCNTHKNMCKHLQIKRNKVMS